MSDHTHLIATDKGRYRLDIWETNKAQTLGYCRWAVYVLIEDLKWWNKLDEGRYPVTFDVAERDGYAALYQHIERLESTSDESETPS